MQLVAVSSALLLLGTAWLPSAQADIYVGHDASGVLILSDVPFAGAQQTYVTPPPALPAWAPEAAPAAPGAVARPDAAASPAAVAPGAIDPLPADTAPAPGKSFLHED